MRIAIVNDLALARTVLRRLVESVPGYAVAWTAADGAQAVRLAHSDLPDAILMDLVMPVMSGEEATRLIMATSPCPILIVTASLGANFGKVYEALGAGGLDAVKTPTLGPDGKVQGGEMILDRLAKLARTRDAQEAGRNRASAIPPVPVRAELAPLLALGASTGGPEALAQVLATLAPRPPVPVVLVQHIAADFTPGLVTWLRGRTGLSVRLVTEGTAPEPGVVDVAGSNDHLILGPDQRFAYTAEPRTYPYRPSVDVLFESLAAAGRRSGVAVLLTGMGSDGARGLGQLRKLGWHTIAQDQETSVVYGMPRAAAEIGAAVEVLPLSRIGAAALSRLRS
jgi:two-component system response regulator WspF